MSSRGPNSYDVGYVHILGHEERTHPIHGNSKISTHPLINRLIDRRIGKVGFNETELGNLTGIQMGPLHKKMYGTREKLDCSLVK
jgi:hypothetical protein